MSIWNAKVGLRGIIVLASLFGAVSCGGGYYSGSGSPNSANSAPASSSSSSSASSNADSFEDDKARILKQVPTWDEGTGATVRFLKESSGTRLSLIFVDTTAPAWNEDQKLWLIAAVAKDGDDAVIGHLIIGLSSLDPGTYEGGPSSKSAVMAVLLGERKWDGNHPEASWSVNDGSWCRVVLRSAGGGNLEGDFQAKLVDNKGEQYMSIENGYLYINKKG